MGRILAGIIAALAARSAAAQQSSSGGCRPGLTAMGDAGDGWAVCERLGVAGGAVEFAQHGGSPPPVVVLRKTAEPLYVDEGGSYLGLNKADALGSHADLLGNTLLANAARRGRDLTLAEIAAVVPPIVLNGETHTFVGSRGSSVDVVTDALTSDVNNMGYPTVNQAVLSNAKGARSAIFQQPLNLTGSREGLWGDYLPVVSLYYPTVTPPPPVAFPAAPAGWQRFIGHCMSQPPRITGNCADPAHIIEYHPCDATKPYPESCFQDAEKACAASSSCSSFAITDSQGEAHYEARPPSPPSPDSSQFCSTCSSLPSLRVALKPAWCQLPDACKLHTERVLTPHISLLF